MDIEELLEWERRGWQSLCDGTGAEFYREIMTEDGVMVLANGAVMNRDEVAASLGDAPPWTSFEIEDPRIVSLGSDSAALVYRGSASRGADEPPFVALMASTYVNRGRAVALAIYQQTPVTEPDA